MNGTRWRRTGICGNIDGDILEYQWNMLGNQHVGLSMRYLGISMEYVDWRMNCQDMGQLFPQGFRGSIAQGGRGGRGSVKIVPGA